jgi:predicted O-methyltransferase YrrM
MDAETRAGTAPRLSRATVRWTYRFVLGREPESEVVLAAWVASDDFTGLREGVLNSPEFVTHALGGFVERGGWALGPVTDEAVSVLLALRDGAMPEAAAVARARGAAPDLPALRRLLLDSPEMQARLPPLPAPSLRTLHAGGLSFALRAAPEEPEMAHFPGPAPRHASLLRACLPEGRRGAVILDDGAGIGLSLLGFAAGAPEHAALLGFEGRLHEAAVLSANIAANSLERARAFAVPLDDPTALLAREGLARVDVLRLAGAGVGARLAAWAPALVAQGTLVVAEFDLMEALADLSSHPRAVLGAWRALYPHASAFTTEGEVYAVEAAADVSRFLLGALARPDRRDVLVLSVGAGWRELHFGF